MERLGPIAARVLEGVHRRHEWVEDLKRGHRSVPRIVKIVQPETIDGQGAPGDEEAPKEKQGVSNPGHSAASRELTDFS